MSEHNECLDESGSSSFRFLIMYLHYKVYEPRIAKNSYLTGKRRIVVAVSVRLLKYEDL